MSLKQLLDLTVECNHPSGLTQNKNRKIEYTPPPFVDLLWALAKSISASGSIYGFTALTLNVWAENIPIFEFSFLRSGVPRPLWAHLVPFLLQATVVINI